MDGWDWAAVVALGILVGACVGLGLWADRQRRRVRVLERENRRWRTLALDRADRVAIVSHEVRTPLTLIQGACELLADGSAGELAPRQAAMVDTIEVKSREVVGIAQDLLTDARIDAQLFQFRATAVDMRRLANGVVRDLRRLYPNRISLSVRGAPPRIVGDPQLLRQALTNLVTNAARHAGDAARISVTVRRREDSVLVQVSDDGTGMSPELTRELFRRSLEGKSQSGNGLGMLITRRIVELHGGRIMVDTALDAGTTILCSLPRSGPRAETVEEEADG